MSRLTGWQMVRRTVVLATVAAVGLFCAGDAYLASFDAAREVNQADAPQGRPYRAVVLQDDPSSGIETVYIRGGHGVLSREWVAVCQGVYELKSAGWLSPDQFFVTLQDDLDAHRNGETFIVQVDPATGRPRPRTDADLNCVRT